jgi:aldehyde:ferredoxin oxidoreductase
MGELLQGRFGWDPADITLQRLGRKTLVLEHAFNRAAGLATAADRLPEWMNMEPLPPHDCVFDVSEDDLDGVKDL